MATRDPQFLRSIIGRERDPNDPAMAELISTVGNFLHLECGHRVLHYDVSEQVEGEIFCEQCRDKVSRDELSGKGT
jgi:hypothetical protein